MTRSGSPAWSKGRNPDFLKTIFCFLTWIKVEGRGTTYFHLHEPESSFPVMEDPLMVKRKIIKIDEEKCDGCGLCVDACHEGAIRLVEGKARLVSETYCDGLGDCLGECPQGAITIEEREAAPFDEKAVKQYLEAENKKADAPAAAPAAGGGCPGAALRIFGPTAETHASGGCPGSALRTLSGGNAPVAHDTQSVCPSSRLGHWPVQLKLVPPGAPFLEDAHILVCADCVPFTVPDFHDRYLYGRAVFVGCPKLDDLAYYLDKMKALFAQAAPRSITVLKMQVPCCSGIAQAALRARDEGAPSTPLTVITIGLRGEEFHREVCEPDTTTSPA